MSDLLLFCQQTTKFLMQFTLLAFHLLHDMGDHGERAKLVLADDRNSDFHSIHDIAYLGELVAQETELRLGA